MIMNYYYNTVLLQYTRVKKLRVSVASILIVLFLIELYQFTFVIPHELHLNTKNHADVGPSGPASDPGSD